MTPPIESLTDDQARQAVKLLFDVLPPDLWEGGRKPAQEGIRTFALELREASSGAEQQAIDGLLEPNDPQRIAAQAAVARLVLRQAEQSPGLAPYCEKAIELATTPHMAIDPITGAFVLMLLLCTTNVEKTKSGWKLELGGQAKNIVGALRLPELAAQLPAVIKALPSAIVSGLLLKGG